MSQHTVPESKRDFYTYIKATGLNKSSYSVPEVLRIVEEALQQQKSEIEKQIDELLASNEQHIKECKLQGEQKSNWLWFNKGLLEIKGLLTQPKE